MPWIVKILYIFTLLFLFLFFLPFLFLGLHHAKAVIAAGKQMSMLRVVEWCLKKKYYTDNEPQIL